MGSGLIIFLLALLNVSAFASDVPWYIGQPVVEVEIETATGQATESDLAPILRTKEGTQLDAGSIRADVSLLVRAGGFASVEALVEPVTSGTGVRVVYRVVLAPRVRSIKVRGASKRVAKRAVIAALGVDLGDPWFGQEDEVALTGRAVKRLNAAGWTQATVTVDTDLTENEVNLVVRVVLNEAQTVSKIRVGGDSPVSRNQVLRWIRKGGVKVGKRVDREGEESARKRILEELRKRGWDRARVNLFSRNRSAENEVEITALLTPGAQLLINASGRKLPNKRILRDTIGIRAGDRITDNIRADAARRLADWYAGKGFLDATVDVNVLQAKGDRTELDVNAKPGPRYWVKKVIWPDDVGLKKRDLLGVFAESAPESLGDRILTMNGLDEVKEALSERFAAEGYLDANVSMDFSKGPKGWVSLPFRFGVPVRIQGSVDRGAQIRLDQIVVGGGVNLETKLVSAWRTEHEGRPLNAAAAARLEKAISDIYEANGYLEVDTTLQTVRNRVDDSAVVDIRIQEGDQVHLRSIVIRGNRRTQRKVIEREIMLSVGEPVPAEAITETRNNLYNLDLFRLVSPELIGEEAGSKDLVLRLEERANILLEAGGGVSTDEGVRTTGRVTHRNIAGLGHRLTTLGTIGYGWFGDEWTVDTASPVWRAASRYELPYIPGRGGRLVFEGLIHETIQEPTWRLSRSGGAIGLKMRLSKRAEAVVDYRVQVRRLVDVDPGSLVNGDPWLPYLGLTEDLAGDPILESGDRVVSGGSLLLVNDARDDRFNPKDGTLWSTHVEVGDAIFSGDVTLRVTAKVEHLIPVGPIVLDFVGRGGIGMAQGRRSTLPLEERFFLGGGTTLRGFSTNSVGPANFARRPEINHPTQTESVIDGLALYDNSGQWAATGGDAMAAATMEIRVPLPILGFRRLDNVDLVFFSDVGHVGFLDSTVVTTSRLEESDPWLRSSVGTGIRFATPVGPASLDVGFNTSPIRARNEPWVLPHLTLGVL